MSSRDALLPLVDAIYDCVLDPAGWPGVLERIATHLNADCIGISLVDPLERKVHFMSNWNVSDEVMLRFQARNDINPVLTSGWFVDVDQPFTTAMYMGESEYLASRFYREIIRPHGWQDAILTILAKSRTRFGALTIPRKPESPPITAAELDFVRRISPHLRRSLSILDILGAKALHESTLSLALDLLTVGVILIDGAGRLVHANASGQSHLSSGAAIRRDGASLSTRDPDAAVALAEAIGLAAQGAAIAVTGSGIALPIPSADGPDLAAWVLPLDAGARRDLAATFDARVAVFIHALGDTSPFPGELFVKRYGVSPAECRVLMMLVQGMAPADVADCLGISVPTVRTHLARLFEKTGSETQADLMRLAMTALAPAAGGPAPG